MPIYNKLKKNISQGSSRKCGQCVALWLLAIGLFSYFFLFVVLLMCLGDPV